MKKKTSKLTVKNKKEILKIASIITVIVVAVLAVWLYAIPTINNGLRKDRITTIFNSLNLDNKQYMLTYESIFGDKRIYTWD